MTRIKTVRFWLHGLISTFIGGVAGAISNIAVDAIMKGAVVINARELFIKSLITGVILAAGYLKQSPLPKMDEDDLDYSPPTPPLGKVGLLLFTIGISFVLIGCESVPANHIHIVAPSGKYDIGTPKNVDITKFQAAVTSNGLFTVSFDHWSSTNDPNVIDKATAGRVAELNALGGIAGAIAEKAVQGAK